MKKSEVLVTNGSDNYRRHVAACGRRRATAKTVTSVVEAVGGTIETDRDSLYTHITIDAPRYQVWGASGTHVLCGSYLTGDRDDRDKAWADALERVDHGLTRCVANDCDVCEEEE